MIDRIHPLAAIFPMLPDDELAALADSIATTGLRHPIVTADMADPDTGEVVEVIADGRNRLAACRLVGVEPQFEKLNGVDVAALILAENVDRRNLNAGQRAMARAMLSPQGAPGKRNDLSRNRERLAKTEANAVTQARFVLRHDPVLAQSVMAGAESLNAAYDTARQRVGQAQSNEAKLAAIRQAAPDIAAMVDDGAIGLDAALAEFADRQRRETEIREAARRSVTTLVGSAMTHLANIRGGMNLGEPSCDPGELRGLIGHLQSLLTETESRT